MKKTLSLFMITALFGLEFLISGCEKPGEGEKAERGYQACQPIIDALVNYSADTVAYPQNLDALVPEYLVEIPQEVNSYPIRYTLTPASYLLGLSWRIRLCVADAIAAQAIG